MSAAAHPPASSARAAPENGVDPALFGALHWRSIGPYRGGRAVAVAGVAGDPNVFYFGAVGGGVWATKNAGRTWSPIMDAMPVASIGALAVAPSDPRTIYAGSGEADMRSDIIHGNGMYRSTDGGANWTHIGFDDSRQIGRILVDPNDPKMLLVAVLGHAYGPSDMRGVYRSSDGGETWTRTLFLNRDTGAIDLAADPSMRVVFASLWQTRRPPWSVYPPSSGPGSGLYRSSDGGITWTPVHGGLPSEGLGKIGIAVAPSDPRRVYAIVQAKAGGLYRSDDDGATWRLQNGDVHLWERGWYFCHVTVDPKDPDTLYVSDTWLYRSRDGGASFGAIKGSKDGDDFHKLWIDPSDSRRMVLGSDQGASVSVDGAATWSSWFNQPTGQFYHVAADAAFPYRLYGAQQDSGAAMILSRSDHAKIWARDWRPISAGGESGYVAPDPRDSNLVFGGAVDREDLRSNQTRSVSPTAGKPGPWREEWTLPLVFGRDAELYFGDQFVWRTRDRGAHWERISDDLARRRAGVPDTLDAASAVNVSEPEPHGVVYALGPSPVRSNALWAGTDDGLIHLTLDGGRTWRNVTPPHLGAWSHVTCIEASHVDWRVAYVAVDRHRLDDDRPYVYTTNDAGKTWHERHDGIPDGSFVNAVREDPMRRGLLYAATETGVFVSFDDGTSWQSLRLDMPVVSVRDLVVRDGDLAIATHGRGFWILDDIEPLRELAADRSSGARLFAPRTAIRTRDGDDEAETSPPETPGGANPWNGAYIDFVDGGLPGATRLEIRDRAGVVVAYWANNSRPVGIVRAVLGPPGRAVRAIRFIWGFHAGDESGPLAPPGRYAVRVDMGGRTFRATLGVRRDPRIAASDEDLVAQYRLAAQVHALRIRAATAVGAATALRASLDAPARARLDAVVGLPPVRDPANSVGAVDLNPTTLRARVRLLRGLEDQVESADSRPSPDEYSTWRALGQATRDSLRNLAKLTAAHP